ncbi:Calcium channel flower [Blattella germanica]|nr:Calcium channel flower [Blattella germanica]
MYSLAEKLGAIMQRPGQDPVPKDDVPWWMKYAGRGLGTVGSLSTLAGALVIVIEAPCCCLFIDFVQNFSDWVEKRPYWNRGALYCGIAIPAIFMCPGLGSIFGSGLIFTTGVIYGLMALGKKGTRQDMAAMASPPQASTPQADHNTTLMEDPDVWRPT